MDDINPEQRLLEKIKDCQKTTRNLLKEYESLLQKQKSTYTTGDSGHSVKNPLTNDVTKQLKDIDLVLESNQQQLKLALKQHLSIQSALSTSADRSTIQSDNNLMQIGKVSINQQVKLSDNKGQNEAKLNPTVQALFTGTLPDEFFLHLMSFMGIQDCLFSNRLVCPLWNELVIDRCHYQKSLKLFENFNCLMNFGEMLLKYEKTEDTSLILKYVGDELVFEALETDHVEQQFVNSLNQEEDDDQVDTEEDEEDSEEDFEEEQDTAEVLTAFLPNVEELVLCPQFNTHINIEHLLQFYADQLTSLTMTKFGPWHESPASLLQDFTFPKLKSLNTFHFSPSNDQLLSLLPQLESLTIPSANMSLEALLRTGTRLRELTLDYTVSVYTAPVDDFSKLPPINTNLRKFTFGSTEKELEALEFISLNLTSLECLKLNCDLYKDNLTLLSPYLVPLTQLHSLTLTASLPFFLLDDTQLAELKSLSSVRQLKLLLSDCDSLSMEPFSKSLFAAFPKVEQVLIAFVDDCGAGPDSATFAAFEAFASKHPTVVQLFRSKFLSKFTTFPNAVAPLLGHHRQRYEEFIEEEELFGLSICKLTAALVKQEGEDVPNLKIALRPADRLAAMSNLLQLLESDAFAKQKLFAMIPRMVHCALKYDTSQGALFTVTSKCVLSLLDCPLVDTLNSYPYLRMMLDLVEHHKSQQINDKDVLQLYKRMVKLLKVQVDSFGDDELKFKILLKLAAYCQTEQPSVFDNDEKLLLQIDNLIDDHLKKFESKQLLDEVIVKFIRSKNRLYRAEMLRALTRCGERTDDGFKWLFREGDSSDGSSSESEF